MANSQQGARLKQIDEELTPELIELGQELVELVPELDNSMRSLLS